jgi:hypothetical protein
MILSNRHVKLALLLVCFAVVHNSVGCVRGDDPETVFLINEHVSPRSIKTMKDDNGVDRIFSLGLPDKRSALEVLPHLGKLKYLTTLSISYRKLNDEDLKSLPPLPQLRNLILAQTEISDESLKYLSKMAELRKLDLRLTRVQGPGFESLRGLTKLETLLMTGSMMDDSAMPHIVNNFKKLKRFDLDETNVTPEGLMQLAELHWLTAVGSPDDITSFKGDRKAQREAKMELARKYVQAYKKSKRKAREAGEDVPPDDVGPFGLIE